MLTLNYHAALINVSEGLRVLFNKLCDYSNRLWNGIWHEWFRNDGDDTVIFTLLCLNIWCIFMFLVSASHAAQLAQKPKVGGNRCEYNYD